MKKIKKLIEQKKNKKGFTLVELLAVMVVLSLILVLVAPNVLQSMNQSKEKSMRTFAKRMINEARTQYELDKFNATNGISTYKSYLIKGKLATDQNQYVGCVVIQSDTKYLVFMADTSNGYFINGASGATGVDSATLERNKSYTTDGAVPIPKNTLAASDGSVKCAAK